MKHHVAEDQVRAKLMDYVDSRITLAELDAWLSAASWDDSNASPLAHQAELLIAESSLGHRPDLASDLLRLASERRVDAAVPA